MKHCKCKICNTYCLIKDITSASGHVPKICHIDKMRTLYKDSNELETNDKIKAENLTKEEILMSSTANIFEIGLLEFTVKKNLVLKGNN